MTSTLAPRTGSLLLIALAPLFAAGCGDEATGEAPPTVAPSFVGRVDGQDAVVGAVSDGARATVYVCGGATTYQSMTHWFTGPIAPDGSLDLSNAAGDWKVSGNLLAGSGQITSDTGGTYTWHAQETSGDVDGLYEAKDGSCRTGAVVGDLDGTGTTRLQGVWCDGKDDFEQVIPLSPAIAATFQGIAIEVMAPEAKQLLVTRVRHP